MSSDRQLREAFGDAMSLPDGAVKFEALDSAIRQADAAGEEALAFEFRLAAIQPYHFGGDHRRAFLAFSQCLAAFDRDPSLASTYTEQDLLWKFKWMVGTLTDFPDIPLARTYAVLEDMQRRYLRGGYSLHAVHQRRCQVAVHVGDLVQAELSYQDMLTAKRDGLSDCRVCVPSAQTRLLTAFGRHEEAVAAGEPAKQGSCARQPQWVQAYLMEPCLRTGRFTEAAELHRSSYRRMRTSHTYLAGIGLHLSFLAMSGNEARGLELVERHLPWLETSRTPADCLHFAATAVLVLNRVSAKGFGGSPIRRGPDGTATTADALATELARYTRQLAARFDARNGTTRQSELAEQRMTAPQLAEQLSLSVLDGAATTTRQRLATARKMYKRSKENAFAMVEETVAALERQGPSEDLWHARHALWDLYRADYRQRDAALAVLDELLAAEKLPGGIPAKAALLEESVRLLHGRDAALRCVAAADRHRDGGDIAGELRTLAWALQRGSGEAEALSWLDRADAIDASGYPLEKSNLECAAIGVLRAHDRLGEALARAESAHRHWVQAGSPGSDPVAWHLGDLLLRLGRSADAERHARQRIADAAADEDDYLLLVRVLRAQGRTEEAETLRREQNLEGWDLDEDET